MLFRSGVEDIATDRSGVPGRRGALSNGSDRCLVTGETALMQMNPLLLTDVFWVAALLAMGFFSIVLIRAHLRPSAARWFSMLICAACLNVLGVILTDLIHQDNQIGLRAISIGRAFIPFCLLGFSLVFPYRSRLARSKPALLVLALPSLVTVVDRKSVV